MNKSTTPRTAIIDLDIPLYQCAARAEKEWEGAEECIQHVCAKIEHIKASAFCSEALLVYSGPENFRKILFPETYKVGRGPKPDVYAETLAGVLELYGPDVCITRDGIEADDYIGVKATDGSVLNPVICSIDKDLLQIPGWHYRFGYAHYPEGDSFPRLVTEEEASKNLFIQLLTGDSTDGIKGLVGVGKVGAQREYEIVAAHTDWSPRLGGAIRCAEEAYHDKGQVADFSDNLLQAFIWRSPMPSYVRTLANRHPYLNNYLDNWKGLQ